MTRSCRRPTREPHRRGSRSPAIRTTRTGPSRSWPLGAGDRAPGADWSRLLAAPPNRFTAANKSGYANPALDQLIDQLTGSVAERDQATALRDLGEIMANDLPALPMYLEVLLAAVGKGVRALDDSPGTGDPRSLARGAHLWDRE